MQVQRPLHFDDDNPNSTFQKLFFHPTLVRIRKKKKTITFDFKKGEWIVSKQFGEGKIEFLEGENDKMTALIDFDDYGLKKLMLKFANLTRLNIED